MIKTHCDICDAVIKDLETRYKLIKREYIILRGMEDTKLEICKDCLDKILKAGDIK